jgi:hypothetical protein
MRQPGQAVRAQRLKNEDKLHFGSESVLAKQISTYEANGKPGSLSAAFLLQQKSF